MTMDIEHFLSNLEQLLLDGQKSRATDLLTEFLFNAHGKPTSLDLCDFQTIAHKSPLEIVAFLRVSLRAFAPAQPQSDSEAEWQLSSGDLSLIDEIAKETHRKTATYLIDEEFIQDRYSQGEVKGAHPWSVLRNKESGMTLDDSSRLNADKGEDKRQGQSKPFSPEDHVESKVAVSKEDSDLDDIAPDDSTPEKNYDINLHDGFEVDEIDSDDPVLEISICEQKVSELLDYEELDGTDDEEDFEDRDHFFDALPDEDRISIADRALQIAIVVGSEFGLAHAEIEFLQHVFVEHGWGNARITFVSLLSRGTTIEELRLAKQLKDLWEDRRDLWTGFYHRRRDASDYAYESARTLSWAFAAKFVKIFPEDVVFDEVEYFIDESYDHWWSNKRKYYRRFIDYLKDMAELFDNRDCHRNLAIDQGHHNYYETNDNGSVFSSPLYRKLAQMELIPEIWITEFENRQSTPIPAVMNDYSGSRFDSGKGGGNDR